MHIVYSFSSFFPSDNLCTATTVIFTICYDFSYFRWNLFEGLIPTPVPSYYLEEELDVLRVEQNDASEIQLPDRKIKLQCNQTLLKTIRAISLRPLHFPFMVFYWCGASWLIMVYLPVRWV